ARAAWHARADRHHRHRGHRPGGVDAGSRDRADGYHDAADGRLSDHAGDPGDAGIAPAADHRFDGEGDEGRPREMSRGRRLGLPGKTRQYRAAFVGVAHVAPPLEGNMTDHEKVNILLVDDQPGKLLSYEAILHGLNENLLKASSGREALEHLLKTD